MPEELMILEVLRVNNKSIDIVLNQPITEDIQFTIEGEDDFLLDSSKITVTDNSYLGPVPNTKTLVFKEGFELETDKTYRVIATNKLHEGDDAVFVTEEFPAMIDANLEVFGDRILKISFEYPVRNLDSYHRTSEKLSLSNFYILYYNMDTNATSTGDSHYPGSLQFGEGVEIRIAKDLRSIEIQNATAFPNGEHSLIINYNKDYNNQPITDYLMAMDYLGRPFPIVRKPFSIISGRTAAKVTHLQALSRTQVLVTFDAPVVYSPVRVLNPSISNLGLFNDNIEINLEGEYQEVYLSYTSEGEIDFSKTVIVPPGTVPNKGEYDEMIQRVINGEPVRRYGKNFNQLLFNIELNPNHALPVGESIITVKGIRDANGFIVKDFTATVNPPVVKPKLLDVIQIENKPADTTVLELVFSTKMDKESAMTKTNYVIYDENNKAVELDDITILSNCVVESNPTDCDVYSMKIHPELNAGEYKLVATPNLVDKLETPIDMTTIVFIAEDYTVPTVKQILVRDNVLVVKYDEPMSVIGEHSILEPVNYRIADESASVILSLDEALKGEDIYGDKKAVRIVGPDGFDFEADDKVKIGYCKVREIKYVTNRIGNILPICDDHTIDAVVDAININSVDGRLLIIDTNKLVYELTGAENNEFIKVDRKDFILQVGIVTIPIENVEISKNRRSLIITTIGELDASVEDITIKAVANPKTVDLFNKPVVIEDNIFLGVVNKIQSAVEGISLISDNGENTKIAMKFTQQIVEFDKSDFYVSDNLSNFVKITGITQPGEDDSKKEDTLELTFASNPVSSDYKVSVAKAYEYLITIDKNFTPIRDFKDKEVMDYSANKLVWEAVDETDFTTSKFTVTFDVDINELLEDITSVGIGGGFTDYFNGTRAKLTIKGLGAIEFYSKEEIFVNSPNTMTPKLTVVGNKLTIEFTNVDNKALKPDVIRRAIFRPEAYAITDKAEKYYINSINAPAAGLNL